MSPGFTPFSALTHLFFPHCCCGCGSDLLAPDGFLCLGCFSKLPFTCFENLAGNPVEKIFLGRADIRAAMSLFYYTEDSAVRKSLHRFKYGAAKEIGIQFGTWMAERIMPAKRFADCEVVIPLPLHPEKMRKRGFNQAAVLAGALGARTGWPVSSGNLIRKKAAGSQTKKNRVGRWKQIQDSFQLQAPEKLQGKHVLLIDDVITTGATLEAAACLLLTVPGVILSLATVACSVGV